jgi:hypothetical protein
MREVLVLLFDFVHYQRQDIRCPLRPFAPPEVYRFKGQDRLLSEAVMNPQKPT